MAAPPPPPPPLPTPTPTPTPTRPTPPAAVDDGGDEIDVAADADDEDDGVSASLDSGATKEAEIRFGTFCLWTALHTVIALQVRHIRVCAIRMMVRCDARVHAAAAGRSIHLLTRWRRMRSLRRMRWQHGHAIQIIAVHLQRREPFEPMPIGHLLFPRV